MRDHSQSYKYSLVEIITYLHYFIIKSTLTRWKFLQCYNATNSWNCSLSFGKQETSPYLERWPTKVIWRRSCFTQTDTENDCWIKNYIHLRHTHPNLTFIAAKHLLENLELVQHYILIAIYTIRETAIKSYNPILEYTIATRKVWACQRKLSIHLCFS